MKHGRIDANQPAIVKALRQVPGVSVAVTSDLGKGFPDLVVGYLGANYMFELKDPDKPPSARKLTKAEQTFHDNWRGCVLKVTTIEAILRTLNIGAERSGR